jgi:hypothetical protein
MRRLVLRVGRRGAALLAFSSIDVVIGVSFMNPDAAAQTKALPAYAALLRVAPLPVWAWLWLAVAVACLVGAFCEMDRVAFGAAIGIKIVWASGFLAAWIFYDAQRAWLSAATWGVVAALVLVISGWPEPIKIKGGVSV